MKRSLFLLLFCTFTITLSAQRADRVIVINYKILSPEQHSIIYSPCEVKFNVRIYNASKDTVFTFDTFQINLQGPNVFYSPFGYLFPVNKMILPNDSIDYEYSYFSHDSANQNNHYVKNTFRFLNRDKQNFINERGVPKGSIKNYFANFRRRLYGTPFIPKKYRFFDLTTRFITPKTGDTCFQGRVFDVKISVKNIGYDTFFPGFFFNVSYHAFAPTPNDYYYSPNSPIVPGDSVIFSRSHLLTNVQNFERNDLIYCLEISDFRNADTMIILRDMNWNNNKSCIYMTGKLTQKSSLANAQISQFTLFPNPADKTIAINTSTETEIQIINTLGMVLLKTTLPAGESIIDIGDLPSGVYFVKSSMGVKKLLIAH